MLKLNKFLEQVGTLVEQVGPLLQSQQRLEALLEKTCAAVVNLERRKMETTLSGAEASRLVAAEVGDFQPFGGVSTWRCMHSWRKLEEIRAQWRNGCISRGIPLSEALWSLVVEGGFTRAAEEQPEQTINHFDEVVYLEEKISFWRRHIPIAGGTPGDLNLMELQRHIQLQWSVDPPEVLMGDLLGWRQADLIGWMLRHPGASPTAA